MLDNKVAIVTGAGRGLGRAEALELGRLGATVIVNDIGAGLDGEGSEEDPARETVEEIRANGGNAIAHFGDISDWNEARGLIELANDKFGDLDIVVNNAGILRDRMIFNMTEEEWDAVIRVHLKGHFCMSRWASAYWRERSKTEGCPVYGRIVNTASEAFLGGSPRQPNYAAAKAGITALTLSTAQACEKYGVTANVVCPRAYTRMTENVPGFDETRFAPERIAALIAYLASPEAARISGQVFVMYGEMLLVLGPPEVNARFDSDEPWTTQNIASTLTPFYEKREPVTQGFVWRYSA